jgi:excinuclease Cho
VTDHSVMHPTLEQAAISCGGETLADTPRAPGVYRFFNEQSALLYIGKSIDISKRVRSHFADAREPGRQQSMMSAVRRIDCELTAGEVGALLLENAAIKKEKPLYNRRQRRHRKLWTLRLTERVDGFFTVVPSDFCPSAERFEAVYGLFRSRHHIDTALRGLLRDEGLCLRAVGMERGSGPCFQHQIGRCRGACAGQEDAVSHNARLLAVLEHQRIAAWPFPAAVLLHEERAGSGCTGQPRRQYHLINHWSYQGSFSNRRSAMAAARHAPQRAFDRDAYRITLAALRHNRGELLDARSGEALRNPLARDVT